jgi:hypothetical protein
MSGQSTPHELLSPVSFLLALSFRCRLDSVRSIRLQARMRQTDAGGFPLVAREAEPNCSMRSMPPKDSDNTETSTFEDCFSPAWLLGRMIIE